MKHKEHACGYSGCDCAFTTTLEQRRHMNEVHVGKHQRKLPKKTQVELGLRHCAECGKLVDASGRGRHACLTPAVAPQAPRGTRHKKRQLAQRSQSPPSAAKLPRPDAPEDPHPPPQQPTDAAQPSEATSSPIPNDLPGPSHTTQDPTPPEAQPPAAATATASTPHPPSAAAEPAGADAPAPTTVPSQPQPAEDAPPPPLHDPAPTRRYAAQTVPSDAWEAFGTATADALDRVLHAVQHSGVEAAVAELNRLHSMPSQILHDGRASRGRGRRVLRRLELFLTKESPDLEPQLRRRPRPRDPDHILAARLRRQLALGSVARATRCLQSQPVVEPTPEAIAELRALHPPSAPPPPLATDTPAARVTADTLRTVLKRLPRGSAAGPSGWTYEHVRAALLGSEACFDAALRFGNALLAGELPLLPALLASRLVAVKKPKGGTRPIAVGETWLRFVCLCALATCPTIGPSLAPLQLGVGVPGGATCVGHAIRACVADNPDTVVLQVDWANAFNSISRSEMLQAVSSHAPALLPFVQWVYGSPGQLVVDGAPADTQPLLSQTGVRQGDPLGPLLFALTMQKVLLQVCEAHPDIRAVAYADDTFLVGSADTVTAAFPTMCSEGADLGLAVQLAKCEAYSGAREHAERVASTLGVKHAADGLLVAGMPVGTAAFIRGHADAAATATEGLIDTLMRLPLPAQCTFAVLRQSLQFRLHHLPRIAESRHIRASLQRVEKKALAAVLSLIGRESSPDVDAQIQLPTRLGGLGFQPLGDDMGAVECDAAFLSAAALAQKAMTAGPACFRPFDTAAVAAELSEIYGVLNAAYGFWTPHELSPEFVTAGLSSCQRLVHRDNAATRQTLLIRRLQSDRDAGPAALARLHSAACGHSARYLEALPTGPNLQLTDAQFKSAVRFRLGLNPAPPTQRRCPCWCGADLSRASPDHAQVCAKLPLQRTTRHNLLQRAWRRIASRAGVASSIEPTDRHLDAEAAQPGSKGYGNRGDILFASLLDLVLGDVSVVHPAGATEIRVRKSDEVAGASAAGRDAAKRAKHAAGAAGGYSFVPLTVESYGRMGEPARKFLSNLAEKASSVGRVDRGAFLANAERELSVALCRGNAIVFQGCYGCLAKVSGSAWVPGAARPSSEVD